MICTHFFPFSSSSGADDGSVGGCCCQDPYFGSIQMCGAYCVFWGLGWLNFVSVLMT